MAASTVHIRVDTQRLSNLFGQYLAVSKRSASEAINQKSYDITTIAVRTTKRAGKAAIRRYLKGPSNTYPPAPAGAIILNWKLGKRGQPGLYGDEMKAGLEKFIQRQADSINFLRAGWLAAVAIFARKIGRPVGANASKLLARFGYNHGDATVARPGLNPTARFANMAFSRHTSTDSGICWWGGRPRRRAAGTSAVTRSTG